MAAAVDEGELNAELECPVCQEWYTDPVDLTCGHNFCRECVVSAFHAACSNPERSTNREHVDCPVCRKRLFTTETKIKNMPVNLKLRNIVSAVQEKPIAKPTRCKVHNKPHQLYCHNCKDVKCLTCFMKKCSKSGHNTEEIDDMAIHLRSVLASKKGKVAEELGVLKNRTDDAADSTKLLEDDLPFLLEQVHKLRKDLLDEHTTECTKFISRVDAIELSSNSSVVMERSKIKNLSMSAESQGKLESVSVVCNSVHSDLKSIADKLKKILKENKRATEGKKSSNIGASGDSAAAASGNLMDQWLNTSGVMSLIQSLEERISLLRPVSSRPEHPQLELQARYDIGEFINGISFVGGIFQVATRDGITFVVANGGEPETRGPLLEGMNIKDVCEAAYNKQIVLTDDEVDIHKTNDLFLNAPVFTLRQNTNNGGNSAFFSACSVRKHGSWVYILGDMYGLEYWNVGERRWNKSVSVREFNGGVTSIPPSEYRFCVGQQTGTIFFTLLNEGQVGAYDDDDDGMLIWRDDTTCSKPAGIDCDWTKVYVCESDPNNPCVVIFDYAGDVITRVGVLDMECPWSISVLPYTLAVAGKGQLLGPNTVLLFKIWQVDFDEL